MLLPVYLVERNIKEKVAYRLPARTSAFRKVIELLSPDATSQLLEPAFTELLNNSKDDLTRPNLEFGENPFHPIVEMLSSSEWLSRLEADSTLSRTAAKILAHFRRRLDADCDTPRALQRQSLVARRLIVINAARAGCLDQSEVRKFVTVHNAEGFEQLHLPRSRTHSPPPPGATPTTLRWPQMDQATEDFLADILWYWSEAPWPRGEKRVPSDRAVQLEAELYKARGLKQAVEFLPDHGIYRLTGEDPEELETDPEDHTGKDNEGRAYGRTAARHSELAAVNTMLSMHSASLALAAAVLKRTTLKHQNVPEGFSEQKVWRLMAVALIAILHGIELERVLRLGLAEGVSDLGWLTDDDLILEHGNPFSVELQGIIEPKSFRFPIAHEIRDFLTRLRSAIPDAELVVDWFEDNAQHEIVSQLPVLLRLSARTTAHQVKGLHRVFAYAAGLMCNPFVSLPTIGLLTSKAQGFTRSAHSYIAIDCHPLMLSMATVQHELRCLAHIPDRPLKKLYKGSFGAHVRSWRSLCWETGRYARKIQNISQASLLTRSLAGLLGARPRLRHLHPGSLLESHGVPCLVFADKRVTGVNRLRMVPCPSGYQRLTESWGDIPEKEVELPYRKNESYVPASQLEEREWQRITTGIPPQLLDNSTRKAFISWVEETEGEVVRNFLSGHGATVLLPGSGFTLHSPRWLIQKLQPFIEKGAKDSGLQRAAGVLSRWLSSRLVKRRNGRNGGRGRADLYATDAINDSSGPSVPLAALSTRAEEEIVERRRIDSDSVQFTKPVLSVNRPSPLDRALSEAALRPFEIYRQKQWPAGFILCLARRLSIPLTNLLRHQQFYTIDSFFRVKIESSAGSESVDDVYFRVIIAQSEAGHLGFFPIRVCDFESFAREPLAEWLARAQNTGNRKALFGPDKIQVVDVGRVLAQEIARQRPARTPRPHDAFVLACRSLVNECYHCYPGVVAAALAGHRFAALNHYDLQDLFEHRAAEKKVRLTKLDGTTFDHHAIPGCRRRVPTKQQREELIDALSARSAFTSWDDKDWADFFENTFASASRGRIQRLLRRHTALDEQSAWLAATRIRTQLSRRGFMQVAKPLPLLTSKEFDLLAERTLAVIGSREETTQQIRVEKHELRLLFLLAVESGARIGELLRLRVADVNLCGFSPALGTDLHRRCQNDTPDHCILYVDLGKTTAARRHIHIGLFTPDSPRRKQLMNLLVERLKTEKIKRVHPLFPVLATKYNVFSADTSDPGNECSTGPKLDGLYQQFATWLTAGYREIKGREHGRYSIHMVRHQAAITAIQHGITTHFWQGNFHTYLATVADQFGHSSFAVTIYSYLGTAVFCLEFPEKPPASRSKSPPRANRRKSSAPRR